MIEKMMLKLLDPMMDAALVNMLSSEYAENPFLMTTIATKLTPFAMMEAAMRAQTGKSIDRPLGSPNVLSPWKDILLNPRQLHELPTSSLNEVQIKTVIGKNAKKPLKLETPIMITGMSYGGSLSLEMKTAIAKGSAMAGTSTNTGESGLTREERDQSKFLIGQFNRGMRLKEEDLQHFDAIEVQFGQGAWGGGAEITDTSEKIGDDDHLQETWGLKNGESSTIRPRFPNTNSQEDIINLVNHIKEKVDVPVGIKIAGSDFIEYDLEVIAKTNADFIAIDGSEGGTAGSPTTLEDHIGLPTLHSLVRTIDWLEEHEVRDRFSVIIAGGLSTPGHFVKAIAFGADAVYIGTIAIIAALQNQMAKALPTYPPPQLALYSGKLKEELDIDEAASHLYNFIKSCNEELKAAVQVIGKSDIHELNREDLVTVDKDLAQFMGIRYAGSHRKG